MIFGALLELVMTHIFHRKKLDDVGAENLSKIREALTKKKMFSFGHCPKRGGGETPARIF